MNAGAVPVEGILKYMFTSNLTWPLTIIIIIIRKRKKKCVSFQWWLGYLIMKRILAWKLNALRSAWPKPCGNMRGFARELREKSVNDCKSSTVIVSAEGIIENDFLVVFVVVVSIRRADKKKIFACFFASVGSHCNSYFVLFSFFVVVVVTVFLLFIIIIFVCAWTPACSQHAAHWGRRKQSL
ncbi:hypothetical protein TcCL_NonESM02930 [Trypanosoma cruzi]|nr:hypothetical protein TcCL_NonESM02930 [Trypanosoma cruzi]